MAEEKKWHIKLQLKYNFYTKLRCLTPKRVNIFRHNLQNVGLVVHLDQIFSLKVAGTEGVVNTRISS